jgi:hypothetical protein
MDTGYTSIKGAKPNESAPPPNTQPRLMTPVDMPVPANWPDRQCANGTYNGLNINPEPAKNPS